VTGVIDHAGSALWQTPAELNDQRARKPLDTDKTSLLSSPEQHDKLSIVHTAVYQYQVRGGVARQPSGKRAGLRRRRARVQIAAATLSGSSHRQTVHTHRASVHQAAKLVAAL